MKENKLSEHLWNKPLPHGASYDSMIFEQYKLFVEMADRISARRDIANGFFLTLNSIVLGSGAAIINQGITFESRWLFIIPFAVLALQLFFWWSLIISYKKLNGAKFQIIGEFEKKLPASPYGQAEWTYLLKEGKDRETYWPLTHLESKIPWLFFFGYLIALLCLLFS